MLNRITIAGRLTKDPESRTTGEYLVTNIRIACTRSYRNAQNELVSDFFDVTAWAQNSGTFKRPLEKRGFHYH